MHCVLKYFLYLLPKTRLCVSLVKIRPINFQIQFCRKANPRTTPYRRIRDAFGLCKKRLVSLVKKKAITLEFHCSENFYCVHIRSIYSDEADRPLFKLQTLKKTEKKKDMWASQALFVPFFCTIYIISFPVISYTRHS